MHELYCLRVYLSVGWVVTLLYEVSFCAVTLVVHSMHTKESSFQHVNVA